MHEKALARINGGYSVSSTSIGFGSHTPLWYNDEIGLYVLQQTTQTAGAALNISLSNLNNPETFQKTDY